MILAVLLASGAVDPTPIIVAVLAALGGSGMTAFFTLRATNRKLEAQSERIYQEALSLADERAARNVETMQKITATLAARLDATERALDVAKARLETADAKIAELRSNADLVAAERDRAVLAAQFERDKLQRRIVQLEERVTDLLEALPARRRRDSDAADG